MKRAISLLLALSLGVAVPWAHVVFARTPMPTPTATVTASPTLTPRPIATPSGLQQIHRFRGQTWLNAHVSAGPVIAKIGDAICSEPSMPVTPADSTESIYTLDVLSQQLRPGCGREGDPVTFYVEGQQAEPVALWHGGGDSVLDLIAGPPFARFYGTLSMERTPGESIVPFLDGRACGYDRGGGFVAPETTYETVVFFNQQQSGCGVEGSEVTFKLLDAEGNVVAVAQQKGVWHAWYGVEQDTLNGPPENSPQRLDLTFVPVGSVSVANVGDGASQSKGEAMPGFTIALVAAALGGLAIGAALRKWARA